MISNLAREKATNTIDGFETGSNYTKEGTTSRRAAIESALLVDTDKIATVSTLTGQYGKIRWLHHGKLFGSFKNKQFTVGKALRYVNNKLEVIAGTKPVTSIVSTPASGTLSGTQQLSNTLSPTGAGYSTAVYYSSDNEDIATVSASGLVTAVDHGQVTITTMTTGPAMDTCVFQSVSPQNDFKSFSFPVSTATIINTTNHTVAVAVPHDTVVTSLVATFTTSTYIDSIKIGGTAQVSGTTANDFTNPVVYAIKAEDTTAQNWTVTVTVASE